MILIYFFTWIFQSNIQYIGNLGIPILYFNIEYVHPEHCNIIIICHIEIVVIIPCDPVQGTCSMNNIGNIIYIQGAAVKSDDLKK